MGTPGMNDRANVVMTDWSGLYAVQDRSEFRLGKQVLIGDMGFFPVSATAC
ncbi:hypothetical protein [uncultured Dechloromonas sp.]|uniref:hypothetical protein n=1 Tax=uncultured Dechloromonas sp. TaxID=171719 RepID=UPI0025E1790B|nr:hypothetical protein [uncultured Dechloromonas sp.]